MPAPVPTVFFLPGVSFALFLDISQVFTRPRRVRDTEYGWAPSCNIPMYLELASLHDSYPKHPFCLPSGPSCGPVEEVYPWGIIVGHTGSVSTWMDKRITFGNYSPNGYWILEIECDCKAEEYGVERGTQNLYLEMPYFWTQEKESLRRLRCHRKQLKKRVEGCDGQVCGKVQRAQTVQRPKSEITVRPTV